MKIISIIPARGGSKGIKNKNLTLINGKEMLYFSINASLNSSVDETWVSTDSPKIKKVALKYGSQVFNRDPKLAGDIIMPDPALVEFSYKIDFDYLVFIQPTSPLIIPDYINKGVKMILSGEFDSVFTVTKEHWFPRWNTKQEPIGWDIFNRPRRQDKEETFVENGMIYITSKKILQHHKLRYGGKMGFIEIPLKNGFQVDTPEDVDLIRKLLL